VRTKQLEEEFKYVFGVIGILLVWYCIHLYRSYRRKTSI